MVVEDRGSGTVTPDPDARAEEMKRAHRPLFNRRTLRCEHQLRPLLCFCGGGVAFSEKGVDF